MDQQGAMNGLSLSFKRKGIPTQATAWKDLEDMILSKISHWQKDEYRMVPLVGGQIHSNRKQVGDGQGLGDGEWEATVARGQGFSLGR